MQDRLERYADLVVNFGANVQPGQILDLGSGLGKEELTRALTASAYRRGAKFVDVNYWDPHLKRVRVQYASDDVLDFVPGWYGERTLQLGEERAAVILLSGPVAPHLYDDLDPERLGRDVFPRIKEWTTVINQRTVNWCIAPGPSAKWAELVYPQLEPGAALDRLWEQVLHVCRMDEADPERADGVVRATKPLHTQGRIIEGLSVRFEGGRAVQIDAGSEADAEILRTLAAEDDGGTHLGEVALVDGEGRIGPLDTVFYDTLLDENAASHIALGSAYENAVGAEDLERINRSSIHVDFMVGSAEVDVDGITRDGERVPVLRQSGWQL